MNKITIVIMAFNEEQSLKTVVDEIDEVLEGLDCHSEIIIIDDGSNDNTCQISEDIAQQNDRIMVIHHEINQGLGGVYRSGFNSARGEFITFFPADGQYSGSIITLFFKHIMQSDMVLGYLHNKNRSLLASTLSYAERILYRLLFGQIPKFQGILMFRRRILDEIELKSTGRGWGVLLELIIQAQRKGYRLVHFPIEVRSRLSGKSKVNNLRTIFANIKEAFLLRKNLS